MRKDEVTFHSDGFRESRPAVNVTVYARVDSDAAIGAPREYHGDGLDPRFEDWYREQIEDETFAMDYWSFAVESAWESLQADAEEVFGKGVQVYAEGRQGGWAVVDGLPDFESWDAIDLSKWARFAKDARICADGIPGDMAILAAINGFETYIAENRSTDLAEFLAVL